MSETNKRKLNKSGIWLVVIGAVLALYAAMSVWSLPDTLQYMVLSPAVTESEKTVEGQAVKVRSNEDVKALAEALKKSAENEWAGVIERYSLSSSAPSASLSGDKGGGASTALVAAGSDYFTIYPKLLIAGRLIYPEELKNGANVILLNEKLALSIFQMTAPIGRKVTLGETEYRVVGVLREQKGVGDLSVNMAYVPLASLYTVDFTLETLTVTAVPFPAQGALSNFASTVSSWKQGGDVYSIQKEKMRSLLSLRYLLCAAWLFFTIWALKIVNALLLNWLDRYRGRLLHQYALRLAPQTFGGCAVLFALYAVCAVSFVFMVQFALEPVYTFPEWIPTVLVEPEDIVAAFWNVRDMSSKTVELRSPQLIRLRFFAMLARFAVMFVLGGGLMNRLNVLRLKMARRVRDA
ncbi:MAG: ABC transporter permease [Eubacteriales bacterium]|nr:ABC transporter permease [Eubacteriales bacterium]MDD3880865.1 ABC transporter permease [Eubacteriales bacterium]MDD4511768.1 ABC transporter permease [Eubacteriales bacterium]